MNTGEKIKELRQNRGMTQEELGTYANTTKQTIHKYETGIITNIPANKIKLIATALCTTPGELMGWDTDKEKPLTVSDEELLDNELISRLCQLTPEELEKVDAFVQGMLASR